MVFPGRYGRLSSMAAAALILAFSAGGCAYFQDKEEILPGEREEALPIGSDSQRRERSGQETGVYLPRPVDRPAWSQQGGTSTHRGDHLALADSLAEVWQQGIGSGSSTSEVLVSAPVVDGGKVFTIDSQSRVSAYRLDDGTPLWSRDLADDEEEPLLGGVIGTQGGRVIAATGYGAVFALSAEDGTVLWQTEMAIPVHAGPTLYDDKVFLVTMDNQTIALDQETGRQLWTHIGISEAAGILSVSNPAAAEGLVIAAYSSGEIYALRSSNGSVLWSDFFTSSQRFEASSIVADIAAMPVIVDGVVYVVSFAERLIALGLRSGSRIWEREIGGIQTPWVVGDYLYMVTNDQHLLCLDRARGDVLWAQGMRRYRDIREREGPIAWSGPILAGNRLIVLGSNGQAAAFSPWSGEALGQLEFDDPITMAPVVVESTLLILDADANLRAMR